MTTKIFYLVCAIAFAGICIGQAQSPTPSPAQSPTAKHRASKKTQTTASPAASPAASPTAKHRGKKAEATTAAASPAASPATSPKARRARTKTQAAASPAPSASPGKFNLGDLFKPKTSAAAATPAAARPAPARGARTKAAATPAAGGGHGLVWVNTESHVYHKEGSRFYGTTKKGKYVSEADAIKEGDKAAHN